MYKILIVEDDVSKLQRITNSLEKVNGLNISNINNVVDANSAKELLRSNTYDLLILDIAIPERINEAVKSDAGKLLIEEMFERQGLYKIPTYILCVTSYLEVYNKERPYLESKFICFLFCDPTIDDWQGKIEAMAETTFQAKKSRSFCSTEYDSFLCIVCALDRPELRAILNNGWKWENVNVEYDATSYYKSIIEKNGESLQCFAAATPRKGMPAAAILTSKMIYSFRPRYLVMSGITSGYKEKTNFGDIIVADPVWDWGSGKLIEHESKLIFKPETHQLDLEIGIRNKLKIMSQDKHILTLIKNNWQGEEIPNELNMLLGPLASGAAVLADGETHKKLLDQHRGLLGVDMESYAVFAAVQESTMQRPNVFTIKSVVDHADGEKNDKYQSYGSYTSAQAIKYFVENYL